MKLHHHACRYWITTMIICLSGFNVFASSSNKVLIIDSYGSDYQWSNSIIDGINLHLKAVYPGIELNIEYLSSELFTKTNNWKLKMNTILDSYQDALPLAIIFISDEAWLAFNSVNTERFQDVPLLLCAVKPHTIQVDEYYQNIDQLQLSHFQPTREVMKKYNATGILREMNVSGYLKLMKKMLPDMDRLALVTDNRFYGIYTRLIFEEEVKKNYANYPVEYLDARLVKTDSLLKSLPKITSTTGLLLTSWLTGEHGFEYSKDFIYNEMSAELKTPIFITNDIGLEKGFFLGGYFNHSEFWGRKIATMLLDVINGKSPRDIEPITAIDEQCHINWEVLQKFNLSPDNLPDDIIYENQPESLFEKYKIQILSLILMFAIIVSAYIYMLRSHLRLQKAQKQLQQAVETTTATNEQLQEMRQDLIVALEKAKESDRLKSAFLANMSHEIRTPLNAIVGFSELITTGDSDEELRAESAIIIKRNSDLLLHLISSILDISKIEAGTLHFNYEEVNLNMICHDVITSLHLKCDPGVKLSFLPPAQPIIAHTDPNRLMQVLVNLINNAIKFTHVGSIEVSYFPDDEGFVIFHVKDTGIGIAPDKIEVIFDRFMKVNNHIEGTGLGLSICKTIVKFLGGEIHVESKLNVGSLFWFRIKKRME